MAELASSFRYLSPAMRVHAGMGALSQLSREAERLGARRALVVCGQSVAHTTNLVARTREALGDLYAGVYDGAIRESPVSTVGAGVEAARAAGADLIVAVGGGSTVVTVRAITILLAEEGTASDLATQYLPGQAPVSPRLMQPKLPNIAVLTTPTTAVHRGGSALRAPRPPFRLELFDPKTRPAAVILDGDALATAPLSLFHGTAAWTLIGVLGALQSPGLNPFNSADLHQALELSLTYMPLLTARPQDREVRIQLAAAALLANRAADAPGGGRRGAGTGATQWLRYRYDHIGQGPADAALMIAEMRYNRETTVEEQARLADILGARREGMSPEEAAEAGTQALIGLFHSLGISTRLRDLGVPEADLPAIAAETVAHPSVEGGPRRLTEVGAVLTILREAW